MITHSDLQRDYTSRQGAVNPHGRVVLAAYLQGSIAKGRRCEDAYFPGNCLKANESSDLSLPVVRCIWGLTPALI